MAKINKPNKKSKINIPELRKDYNQEYGRFAFSSACNNHCQLCDWQKNELNELVSYFKRIERTLWKDIIKDDGINYETNLKQIDLSRPGTLPPDATLDSMRVSQKMRVYGYRTQDVFNIIWFDRLHIVCPENKKWKYKIS